MLEQRSTKTWFVDFGKLAGSWLIPGERFTRVRWLSLAYHGPHGSAQRKAIELWRIAMPTNCESWPIRWTKRNANQLDRVKLLLERGANPNARSIFDNRTCYQHAVGAGNSEIAELVVRHGGERIEPDSPQEQFYNACMVANREAVDSMRDQHSDNEIASWIQAGESRLPQAAVNNKLDAIRFMLELGFPTSTALFEAAWNGHMDVAKLLVDHGVSASQRHKDHSATPIDYADAADHMELRGCLHLCNTL